MIRIAKMRDDGQFEIVWSSKNPIEPLPFKPFIEVPGWTQLFDGLHKQERDGSPAPREKRT